MVAHGRAVPARGAATRVRTDSRVGPAPPRHTSARNTDGGPAADDLCSGTGRPDDGEPGQPERAGCLWVTIEAEQARTLVGQWEGERDRYAEPILIHAGPEFERERE